MVIYHRSKVDLVVGRYTNLQVENSAPKFLVMVCKLIALKLIHTSLEVPLYFLIVQMYLLQDHRKAVIGAVTVLAEVVISEEVLDGVIEGILF